MNGAGRGKSCRLNIANSIDLCYTSSGSEGGGCRAGMRSGNEVRRPPNDEIKGGNDNEKDDRDADGAGHDVLCYLPGSHRGLPERLTERLTVPVFPFIRMKNRQEKSCRFFLLFLYSCLPLQFTYHRSDPGVGKRDAGKDGEGGGTNGIVDGTDEPFQDQSCSLQQPKSAAAFFIRSAIGTSNGQRDSQS